MDYQKLANILYKNVTLTPEYFYAKYVEIDIFGCYNIKVDGFR